MARQLASVLGFLALAFVALISFGGSASALCGDGACQANDQYYCSWDCDGSSYYGQQYYQDTYYGYAGNTGFVGGYSCYIDAYAADSSGRAVRLDIYTPYYTNQYVTVDCGDGAQYSPLRKYSGWDGHTTATCFYDMPGSVRVYAYPNDGAGTPCFTEFSIGIPPADRSVCGNRVCEPPSEDKYTCGRDCDPDYGHTGGCTGAGCSTPTPTPKPEPWCGISTVQRALTINNGVPTISEISVLYRDFERDVGTIRVYCDNGDFVDAVCSGTRGGCTATCIYPTEGNFAANASEQGVDCGKINYYVDKAAGGDDGDDQPTTPACYRNTGINGCGTNGFTTGTYCTYGSVTRNYTSHVCTNPGLSSARCHHITEPQTLEHCGNGCVNGACVATPPGVPSCTLFASPNPVDEGVETIVSITYTDLLTEPTGQKIQVNCDSISNFETASDCQDRTGICYAQCTYANARAIPYTARVSIGGASCSLPVYVNEVITAPTPHVPVHYDGDNEYTLYAGDSVTADNGFGALVREVLPQSGAQYSYATLYIRNQRGITIKTVTINPSQGAVQVSGTGLSIQMFSARNSAGGANGFFSITSGEVATPTPTPFPGQAWCAITPAFSPVYSGEAASMNIEYHNLARNAQVSVRCSAGESHAAQNCLGTDGSCGTTCTFAQAGSATVSATASGVTCTSASFDVLASDAGGASRDCRDGTANGECSANNPYFCDEGFLVKDAQLCGCPAGYRASGSDCIASTGSCSVTMTPRQVKPGVSASVVVQYTDMASVPESTIFCGDGQSDAAVCTQTSPGKGTCTLSCTYAEQDRYPQAVAFKAYANGMWCARPQGDGSIIAPDATQGILLFKVTSCTDGAALANAQVSVENSADIYTDSMGLVQLSLDAATYHSVVSKSGYQSAPVTKTVTRAKTTTASVCLQEKAACDIDAVLFDTPDAGDASSQLTYEINLTNLEAVAKTVNIRYSSGTYIFGPSSRDLNPGESAIVPVYVIPQDGVTGDSLAMVSFSGRQACTRTVSIPLHVIGGLLLTASKTVVSALPGEKACFPLMLRNTGGSRGTVALGASANGGDDASDFDTSLSSTRFNIAPHEIRDNLEFCVKVPSGASAGARDFTIYASSPISDSSATVTVDVSDTDGFSSSGLGCYYVRDDRQVPIEITNDVADGDYSVSLEYNDVGAVITPQSIYNFKKGSTRTVYLSANPESIDSYERHVQLVLRKGGVSVMQRDVCLRNPGQNYNGGGSGGSGGSYGYSAYASLLQNSITLSRGSTGTVTLKVANDGTYTDSYLIAADGLGGKASPATFTLRPSEEKDVSVSVTANANPGTYTVPVKVYSTRRAASNGGQYYDGYNYDSNGYYDNNGVYHRYNNGYYDDYNYDRYNNYPAIGGGLVQCGDGRSVTADCKSSSGSCAASCDYSSDRQYTVTADVGDTSCEYAKVVSVTASERACQVGVESFAEPDSTVKVTIYYRNLDRVPASREIEVNCGNSDTVHATSCDGTSGSCTAACHYGSTEKAYAVSASIEGQISCGSSRVMVEDRASYCSTDAQPLVVVGHQAAIELNYHGVGYSNGNGQYNPYGGYYNNVLLATENLAVTVTGSGAASPSAPAHSDSITITTIVSQGVPTSGSGTLAISLVNNANKASEPISIFVSELPPGASAAQNAAFTLGPLEKKTVRARIDAGSASPGSYKPRVSISYGTQTTSKPFDLQIVPAGEIIAASIRPAQRLACNGGGKVTAEFFVKNNEQQGIGVSALLLGLPDGWKTTSSPQYEIINPGEEKNFSITIDAQNYDGRDYPAVFEVRQNDGRRASMPYDVPMGQCGGSLLSGLIVLNSSFSVAQLLILLGVLAIGAFMYYSIKPKEGESGQADSAADEENKKNLRQLTLSGIREEVSKTPPATKPEGSESSDEAFVGETSSQDDEWKK